MMLSLPIEKIHKVVCIVCWLLEVFHPVSKKMRKIHEKFRVLRSRVENLSFPCENYF